MSTFEKVSKRKPVPPSSKRPRKEAAIAAGSAGALPRSPEHSDIAARLDSMATELLATSRALVIADIQLLNEAAAALRERYGWVLVPRENCEITEAMMLAGIAAGPVRDNEIARITMRRMFLAMLSGVP